MVLSGCSHLISFRHMLGTTLRMKIVVAAQLRVKRMVKYSSETGIQHSEDTDGRMWWPVVCDALGYNQNHILLSSHSD